MIFNGNNSTFHHVSRYLIEIARSHNVPFEPDARVMQEDEIALAENQLGQLIDFQGIQDKNPNALPPNGVLPDAGKIDAMMNIDARSMDSFVLTKLFHLFPQI